MIYLYNLILFKPLLNLLVWLYDHIGDIGVAIIVITIIIRLILLIPSQRAIKSQKAMQSLQPKLEEIRRKFKDDKQKQSQEMMKFYQQNKINPFSSCLPMLVQLPILFALYGVFRTGLSSSVTQYLYPFVQDPGQINVWFLHFMDMSKPNIILAILAGGFQFFQAKMMLPKTKGKKPVAQGMMGDMGNIMGKQMTYLMPAMTVFIGMSMPAGLTLYWAVTTVFTIAQQYGIMKNKKAEK